MVDSGLTTEIADLDQGYDKQTYDYHPITARDSGAAAIQLSKHTDLIHVSKLKKITNELEDLNVILGNHAALRRAIDDKNNGKSDNYDISELHEKLITFQEHFNKSTPSEAEKIDFDNQIALDALKSKTGKELDAISRKIEDTLGEVKDKASDASNQVYLQGHLYTIVMNIFQELTRTDCRSKERLAQASRGH